MHLYKPKVKQGEGRVMMKIMGVLVDMLVELAPEVYGHCLVFENGKNPVSRGAAGNIWANTSNSLKV